ncbi:MAG: 6-phosphofructokinase [Oscillospiraceae bacterium]|jgi:6-phosphofructokinase 1|nr:6-phosphofructokinase [Oscillospiraceae bacterium]
MNTLKGACIIGQSGGPTSVINASALGAIEAALDSPAVTRVYGAANGIKGVLDDKLYVMDEEDREELGHLRHTPSSALGSCRYKLKDPGADDTDYKRILEIFRKYDVRYFFYNGGNDSMDTCNKISKYMLQNGYECRVMGIPKTIDNDLSGTDHCPGYGSAAKYIAASCMEIYLDARVYDTGMVTVLEIMGRHAGWLTAAAALAGDYAPDLIYLPEADFDMDRFLADVQAIYQKNGKAIIAVSEGIHDENEKLIATYGGAGTHSRDSFGHTQLGGVAAKLAAFARDHTGAKVRGIEFSLLQRCASHIASRTDIDESYAAGRAAVENAVAGVTDKMVAFKCTRDGGYKCEIELVSLETAANTEKKVPREWINEAGNGVLQPYIDYALPLIAGETGQAKINGLPRFAKLRKVLAE